MEIEKHAYLLQNLIVILQIQVFQYLTPLEINRLILVNKKTKSHLDSQTIAALIFKKCYNLRDKSLYQVFQNQKIGTHYPSPIELPYWGFATNGGIYYNSLRFWIGKSFTISRQPRVILNNGTGKIIGKMAKEVQQFRESIIKMSIFLRKTQYFLQKNFGDSLQETNIGQVFAAAYSYFQYYQLNNQQFKEYAQKLRSYVNVMQEYLQQAFQNDLQNLSLPCSQIYSLSLLTRIRVSVECQLNYHINVFLLCSVRNNQQATKWDIDQKRSYNVIQNSINQCKNITIKELIKLDKGIVLFQPQYQEGNFPVAFVNLGNEKTFEYQLKLGQRVLLQNIQLYLLKSIKSEMHQSFVITSAGFGYFSLEGIPLK